MHVVRLFALAIAGVGVAFSNAEASITVESKVDRATILIGDRIIYSVTVQRSADVVVEMPSLGANLGMFEIRDYEVKEPVKKGNLITEQTQYVISTFETGDFEIPPLIIRYQTAADTTKRELRTEPIKITVKSLNPDQAGDIRDIKPPLEIPRNWGRVVRQVAWGLLGIMLVMGGILVYLRYRKGKRLLPRRQKPPRPAHELALEQLDALVRSGLLESGKVKQFYSELSEIIRRYIEGRFFVAALEMTTRQLLEGLEEVALGLQERELLEELLELSDLVKFAKYLPADEEHERAVQGAYDFVHRTRFVVSELAEPAVVAAQQADAPLAGENREGQAPAAVRDR